jgi:hypothetical protein
MGMEDMARKLKELEIKAKAGEEIESYPQYIDDFNEACKIALKDLDEYIKSL